MRLTKEQIKELLPHREPMLLLDEIDSLVPGKCASAIVHVLEDSFFLQGHFPGRPLMPGVLQLEALCQTGAVAVLALPNMRGKIALITGVEKVKFRRPVQPGDTLRLEVELTLLTERGGKGKGSASVEGQTCCQGEITFVLVE